MARGVRWSALDKGGQQGITFVVFVVLARYVQPEDFGLITMALVVIGFMQLFIDQGFSTAIIQREEVDDEFLSTAFWTNLAIGVSLGAVLFSLKDLTGQFFHEPRVAELIPWMAAALLFEALMSVPQALLQRHFNFRGLALRTLFARLIAGGVAIAGAVSGWGVWSLVTFTVLSSALSTVILWWISDWYPKPRFSAQCFRELLRFGGNVTGVRIMSYIDSRILDVLIGYFFGAVILGYYTIAFQLVGRIGAVMVQVLSQVTISGFSRVQASADTLLKHLLGVTRLTTAIAFPLFALLGMMAEDLVFLIFGKGWEQSAMLVSILAPLGPIMVMLSSFADVVVSAGAPHLMFRVRVLSTGLLVAALFAILPLGFEALILVFTASVYVLSMPLYFIVTKKVIPLQVRSYGLQRIPVILATVALMVTVQVTHAWAKISVPNSLGVVLITALSAVIVYVLTLSVLDRRIVADLRRVLFG